MTAHYRLHGKHIFVIENDLDLNGVLAVWNGRMDAFCLNDIIGHIAIISTNFKITELDEKF